MESELRERTAGVASYGNMEDGDARMVQVMVHSGLPHEYGQLDKCISV